MTFTGLSSIENAGTFHFTQTGGNQPITLESDINNTGTIDWEGGNFTSTGGATITNSATMNLNANNGMTGVDIVNTGALNRTVLGTNPLVMTNSITNSGGTLTLDAGTAMTFSGTLVNTGTMTANGQTNFTNGTFDLGGGTMSGTGDLDLHGGNTFSSDVTFGVVSVVHNSFSTLTGTNGANMTIPSGTNYQTINTATITGFSSVDNLSLIHI